MSAHEIVTRLLWRKVGPEAIFLQERIPAPIPMLSDVERASMSAIRYCGIQVPVRILSTHIV